MRGTLLLAALAMCLAWVAGAASRNELYGTWQLETAASKWGIASPAINSGTLTISKHHKTVHMAVTVALDHVVHTDELDWLVDNRYHPIVGPAVGEILAKWDGDTLVGERELTGSHETYRLTVSNGGTTLTETVHHKGSDGIWDRVLIWSRQ